MSSEVEQAMVRYRFSRAEILRGFSNLCRVAFRGNSYAMFALAFVGLALATIAFSLAYGVYGLLNSKPEVALASLVVIVIQDHIIYLLIARMLDNGWLD